MSLVLSFLIWFASGILTFILFLVVFFLAAVTWPFDKQRRICHRQCFWWADAILGMNPYWDIKVKGLSNINPQATYVIVANHQSLGDIIILYKIRAQFKWVAKDSLFKIPVLGWNLSLIKHIRLLRGDMSSIKKIYREAASWLRGGVSVLFFPEGTRSETDEMNPFQNGAFKLAIKEKVPVLPIAIDGTRDAIPKGSWVFDHKVKGTVTVLPPIETKDMTQSDFNDLRDRVRRGIDNAMRHRPD